MARVEIYTGRPCGFCSRAIGLLEERGIEYTAIDISRDPHRSADMVERSGGRRTIPRIFIDGRHVGGYRELARLAASGRLDEWMREIAG